MIIEPDLPLKHGQKIEFERECFDRQADVRHAQALQLPRAHLNFHFKFIEKFANYIEFFADYNSRKENPSPSK